MFGARKKEKVVVIFDIGSSSVGCAHVNMVPGSPPRIAASAREEMVFQDDLKFDRMVSSMLDALERSGKALEGRELPFWKEKEFICSFSSPWYASQTRIASMKADRPFSVTSQLISDAVEKEVEDFETTETKRLGEGVLMEHEAIQVKLNGYETDAPIGKESKIVDIAVYVSIVPKKIFSLVKEKLGRMYHPPKVRFHSFPFIAFVTIRDLFHRENFLFLDISGEVTDISLIRKGVLQETFSFPYGKNHILRALAPQNVEGHHALALSALAMHLSRDLHEENAEKTERTLTEAAEEWLSYFRSALENFAKTSAAVPLDVFFTADDDISPWFAEKIRNEKKAYPGRGDIPFEVRPLEARFWESQVVFESGVQRDAFLAMEAAFAKRNLLT